MKAIKDAMIAADIKFIQAIKGKHTYLTFSEGGRSCSLVFNSYGKFVKFEWNLPEVKIIRNIEKNVKVETKKSKMTPIEYHRLMNELREQGHIK